MPTWGEARTAATARLRASPDPGTASLDADVLLAHVLGVGKEAVFAHPERKLSDEATARYLDLVERRARGEPVAYLRGFKEFYGLRLSVDPRVLIPRPETETLVEAARELIAGRALTVVDVGTGSGAIAVAIAAHEPRVRVIATDISREALTVAEANALASGVGDRVELRHGDLLAPITERVDVVCANLPYLREDTVSEWVGERTSLAFEPRVAVVAGADGLDLIRRCVADLPRVLAPDGAALLECDPPQVGAVADMLARSGLRTRTIRDLAGADRVVAAGR
jgi:release factor glutamine methyltransferase